MARISGLERNIAYPEDKTADMRAIRVSTIQTLYETHKIGWEVNDGKFLNFIDDREEADELWP